jgi:hypothetical protein
MSHDKEIREEKRDEYRLLEEEVKRELAEEKKRKAELVNESSSGEDGTSEDEDQIKKN